MIVLNLSDGSSIQFDPISNDFTIVDSQVIQSKIRRVSIINARGTRVDLPKVLKRSRVIIELIKDRKTKFICGESVIITEGKTYFKAIYYYSDDRIVLHRVI